jgi:hypothetical protein
MRPTFIELARSENRWYEDDFIDLTPDGKYRNGELQFLWTVYQTGASVSAAPLIEALHAMLARFDDSAEAFAQRVACVQARGALSLYIASKQ